MLNVQTRLAIDLAVLKAEIREGFHQADLNELLAEADGELGALCLHTLMLDRHKEGAGEPVTKAMEIIERCGWATVAEFTRLRDAIKYGLGRQWELRDTIGEMFSYLDDIESLANCLQDDDDVGLGKAVLEVVEAIEQAARAAAHTTVSIEEMIDARRPSCRPDDPPTHRGRKASLINGDALSAIPTN